MATFASLYDHVLPYLPGAEPGIVDFHIRRALREFFKRTTVWRETFEFDTTPATDTYNLIPTSGVVASVLEVYVNGRWVPAVPEERRNANAAAGVPDGWFNLLPRVITLYPKPTGVVNVKVVAALTVPIDGAVTYPDDVHSEHAEALAAGAISGMMMMPGKPWTQLEMAAVYGRVYGAALRETRGRLRDGGQPNQSTFVAARPFGV